ncbi:mannose/fructose/sorbose PTS transporter subunit IIB [Listeria kieliensis]|uniref:PTS friuctose transporter subunit IIB n=1 Tax=Listeria kieliensis TaxID=1621700 RepID=A0A3D8TQ52_9LIST|nr:mannose/fructose/sorbose PTS transporter subunit IIB [Listeria kieliensis]RDX00762.1 PTS friuctose transporter subunit IIB [Listeria kieliensis]
MDIRLARIDDRLIHGQVATVWTKETKAERIIVINDAVSRDEFRKTLLIQAAPPAVKVNVIDVAKAIRVYQNPQYATTPVLLLFTNPMDVLTLVKSGVAILSVNIGGMAFRAGKNQITNAVSVDETDKMAFRELHKRGIELEIRKVASDSKVKLMPLLDK